MKWPHLALALLPALGILELGGQVWASHRAPRFDEYAALQPVVRELERENDLVLVAPTWAEPMVEKALGDELMPLTMAARSDVSRFDRAIEISILGHRSPDVRDFEVTSTREVGPFTVRVLENPKVDRVVYDFVDHVAPPVASVFGTDPEVRCDYASNAEVIAGGLGGHPTFGPERFLCPGGEFFNVGPTVIADQDFRPRRCIWSHPFASGQIVTRFEKVPLGQRITGHSGMYWIIERNRAGAPIDLEVRVDGDIVGKVTHTDGQGWAPFDLDLGAHAGAPEADVEFRVSSPNYVDRHFCFEATTR